MEFPDLGLHCSKADCKQLDFLPFTCDACKQAFCLEHRSYLGHNCAEARRRDKRATECPLCRQPVVCTAGEGTSLDEVIDRHIESGCTSEAKERRKKKRCAVRRCRTVELMPVTCGQCQKQYCLGHRLPKDHTCKHVRNSSAATASSKSRTRVIRAVKQSEHTPPMLASKA